MKIRITDTARATKLITVIYRIFSNPCNNQYGVSDWPTNIPTPKMYKENSALNMGIKKRQPSKTAMPIILKTSRTTVIALNTLFNESALSRIIDTFFVPE
jgi:hypothetical protein